MGAAEKQEHDSALLAAAAARNADNDTPKPDQEFLNIEEAATLLRVSENTLREVVRTGAMPWAKPIGKQVRISRTALLKWFETEVAITKKRRGL